MTTPQPITSGSTIHWAFLYDLATGVLGWSVRNLHRRMLEEAKIAAGEQVLDAGCGPGRLARAAALQARTGQVVGIDASPEMVSLATRRAIAASSPVKFLVAPIEAIPLPDASIDVALASLVLHHLPAEVQPRAVAELARVLRPTGRLVIGEFGGEPGHGPLGHVASALGIRRGHTHAETIERLLRDAGFQPVITSPAGAFCTISARRQSASPAIPRTNH